MAFLPLPPGISDITPAETPLWRYIEKTAADVFRLYGYMEIRTPIIEYTEVFQRGIGGETEVVQKEMYTFEDKGGRSLTLRPEGTAGVMRSLAGTDVMNGNEQRVYYIGPMFRGEKPAAGRKRQFHQIGVENAGSLSPLADAENIAMLIHFLKAAGIKNSSLLINTRGSFEDREVAEKILYAQLVKKKAELCRDCNERLNRNIWRIIDCKNSECRKVVDSVPSVTEAFSEETMAYFDEVCKALDLLEIDYTVDKSLVRGLDYYAHTVFEVTHPGLGAQSSIAGGGRYEVSLPGVKRPLKGVGFALGLERIIMARDAEKAEAQDSLPPDIYLVSLGKKALEANIRTAAIFRNAKFSVVACLEEKSMKAQMRAANRISAKFAVIRGDSEIESGTFVCKDMVNSTQDEVKESEIIEYIKNRQRG